LDRDVINPQNGHILEDPISPRDVFVAKSFPSESAREVRKVRRWTRKGCKTEPILSCSTGSRWHIRGSDSVQDCSTHTTALSPQGDSRADLGVELQNQSEQFRPAIVSGMGDHHV